MSTWHQQQNATPLWHETKWTLVTDPPNGCLSVIRFDTREQAEAFLPKAGEHSYIIRHTQRIEP